MKRKEHTQFLIIPLSVADDERLYDGAKILYGRIHALCRKEGFCWATNEYFAMQHGKGVKTIGRWLRNLEDSGYIKMNIMFRDELEKKGDRCISISEPSDGQKCLEFGQKYPENGQKCLESRTKMSENMDKNVQPYTLYNNIMNKVMNKRERITEKNAFGFHENVFLSRSEEEELKEKFPVLFHQILEELSGYMQSTGKTYDDHAATIRLWCERKQNEQKMLQDRKKQKSRITSPPSYDAEQIDADSLKETLMFGA